MRISKVAIENYKGISNLELNLDKKNLLLSTGSLSNYGKTSVLEAITLIMSNVISSFTPNRPLQCEERVLTDGKTCKINLSLINKGNETELSLEKALNYPSRFSKESFMEESDALRRELAKDNGVLPIIMYYPSERLLTKSPQKEYANMNGLTPVNIYKGLGQELDYSFYLSCYSNCLALEKAAKVAYDKDYELGYLRVLREVLADVLPELSEVDYNAVRGSYFANKGTVEVDLRNLSKNEKELYFLFSDIAMRLILANPVEENPLLGKGIVLIDDIEKNLHPKNQGEVLNKLSKLFPNVQFIVTTNSPLVLGSGKDFNVYEIKNKKESNIFNLGSLDDSVYRDVQDTIVIDVALERSLYGLDVNLILETYYKVGSRVPEIEGKISEAYNYLSMGKLEYAEKLYKELTKVLNKRNPELMKMEFMLTRKKSK